jgi:CBS-domain-containing membrane protein
MRLLDVNFRENYRSYLFQSALAGLALFVVLLFLSISRHAVIIAALGSTAFIVFATPSSHSARFRNVVGGHAVGIFSGFLGSLNATGGGAHVLALAYSLAVALAVFLMVVTDTEHPPAAGTALGIAVAGFSVELGVFTLLSAFVLSMTHRILRPWLRDLT